MQRAHHILILAHGRPTLAAARLLTAVRLLAPVVTVLDYRRYHYLVLRLVIEQVRAGLARVLVSVSIEQRILFSVTLHLWQRRVELALFGQLLHPQDGLAPRSRRVMHSAAVAHLRAIRRHDQRKLRRGLDVLVFFDGRLELASLVVLLVVTLTSPRLQARFQIDLLLG